MATGLTSPHRPARSSSQAPLPALIGVSPAVVRARESIQRLKDLPVPVAVIGPTGCGKEIVAQHLHGLSARARTGEFVAVNCGVFPPGTSESLLFGHELGAFTGALRAHQGYVERAHEGTLFLDELADLPQAVQVMLLRVLEEGCITRMGGIDRIPVRFRLIVSSQVPLETLVAQRRLRPDLYWRVKNSVIELPGLATRPEDVLPLLEHFNALLGQAFGRPPLDFPARTLKFLKSCDWLGNVRQFRSALEQLYVEGLAGPIEPEQLRLSSGMKGETRRRGRPRRDLSETQRRAREAMKQTGGDAAAAARLEGISKPTLYRWRKGRR